MKFTPELYFLVLVVIATILMWIRYTVARVLTRGHMPTLANPILPIRPGLRRASATRTHQCDREFGGFRTARADHSPNRRKHARNDLCGQAFRVNTSARFLSTLNGMDGPRSAEAVKAPGVNLSNIKNRITIGPGRKGL